jgi:hypothetical protein
MKSLDACRTLFENDNLFVPGIWGVQGFSDPSRLGTVLGNGTIKRFLTAFGTLSKGTGLERPLPPRVAALLLALGRVEESWGLGSARMGEELRP